MAKNAFFFQRLNDHVQYLRKIQATLNGSGDFHGSDHHDCKLGKWLYDTGPEEASAIGPEAKAIFDRIFEPHERFHRASKTALELREAGDLAGSEKAVTEMMQVSVTLVDILIKLDGAKS